MRATDIYNHLPVPLQELALSLYGLRLQALRYGRGHRSAVAALRNSESWQPEVMRRQHDQWLATALRHAAATVPFYRASGAVAPKIAADALTALAEWPLLSKADVQAAGSDLVSEVSTGRRLAVIHTGGTTGRALAIWCDRRTLQRNYAFFERQKRWAGVARAARVATFAGRPIVAPDAARPPYWRHNFAAHQLLCSSYHLSHDTLADYVDALARFAPALIDTYPSSIEPIARRILETGDVRVRPHAVITSSETLFPVARQMIEEAFSCKVFDHYGSAEMVAFVTQCEHGRYHPNSEYGHLEILRADGSQAAVGEEGEIVATGFINEVMPLIRYKIGDMAAYSDEQCPCGRPYPVLRQITGRLDDVILTPEGRRVARLDPIFKAVQALHEARIVQTALDRVRVDIVAGPGFRAEDRAELVRELALRLGPSVQIETQFIDALPRTGRGKLRTVYSPFANPGTDGPTGHSALDA